MQLHARVYEVAEHWGCQAFADYAFTCFLDTATACEQAELESAAWADYRHVELPNRGIHLKSAVVMAWSVRGNTLQDRVQTSKLLQMIPEFATDLACTLLRIPFPKTMPERTWIEVASKKRRLCWGMSASRNFGEMLPVRSTNMHRRMTDSGLESLGQGSRDVK